MRDRILFTAPMVCAIRRGQKTQTRREVKGLEEGVCCLGIEKDGTYLFTRGHAYAKVQCPYGKPGSRLYVCETFYAYGRWETRFSAKKGRDEWHFVDRTEELGLPYKYAADAPEVMISSRNSVYSGWHRRPAIFMPRKAVRIVLEVVIVRVERLQDITEADAVTEGVQPTGGGRYWLGADGLTPRGSARDAYRDLWEHINGAGSWESNPWVWVYEFKEIEDQNHV